MADNLGLSGSIDIGTSAAQSNLKNLQSEAERLAQALTGLEVGTADYAAAQKQLATNSVALSRAQKDLATATSSAGKATRDAAVAATEAIKQQQIAQKALNDEAERGAKTARAAANVDPTPGASSSIYKSNPSNNANTTAAAVAKDQAAVNAATNQMAASWAKQYAQASKLDQQFAKERIASEVSVQTQRAQQAAQSNAVQIKSAQALRDAELKAMRESFLPDTETLNQTSYSLFNVAQSVGIVGAAMTAAGTSAIYFGAQYETAFSQVERTALPTQEAAESLQGALIELSQTIPVGFTQLSSIAALGAQMGIATEDLDTFSDTTARYAAVTGVTTDAAAQDFGSLFELLNVGSKDFENLASAVNYVGVTSVATDSEILNMATSIGASTTQAGFLADQTIGLAGALSSLRIQPEQARGVILRLFADFDKAVSSGGTQLAAYAKVLGQTSDATAKLYKTDPSEFFNELLKGLSTAKDLNGALGALSISETREVNVLQRLAGNYDTYTAAMQNANQAYSDGTFLGESYGKIAQTLGARVQILVNSIQNLLAKAGQSIGPILEPIIAILTTIVQGFDAIPAPVLAVVTAITILAGTFALIVAGGLAFVATAGLAAGAINNLKATGGPTTTVLGGLRNVVLELTGAMGVNTVAAKLNSATIGSVGTSAKGAALGLVGKSAAMEADTVATTGATVATNGFKTALLGVPIVNIIAGLSILVPLVATLVGGLNASKEAAAKASEALAQAGGGINEYHAALEADTKAAGGLVTSQNTIKLAVSESAKEAAKAADAHRDQAAAISDAVGATKDAGEASNDTASKLSDETLIVDKNAKAWVANALSKQAAGDKDSPLAAVFNDPKQAQRYSDLGIDIGKAIADGLGKQNGVQDALNKQFDAATKKYTDALGSGGAGNFVAGQAYKDLKANLDETAQAADGLNGQLKATDSIQQALGVSTNGAADALNGEGDGADLAAAKISDLFSAASAAGSYTTDMNALRDAIDENGPAFDQISAGGIANMDALGAALQAASDYGSQLGIPAADSMAQSLASIGGDTSQIIALMQSLAQSNPTLYAKLNIDDVLAKYKQLAALGNAAGTPLGVASAQANLSRLEDQRTKLQAQIKSSQDSASNRSSGTKDKGAAQAAKSAKIAADNAQKIRDSIKTTAEYAADVGSAMKEAFDKKFGVQQSIDDITTKFQALRDRIDEAKKKIQELKVTLQKLASDKNILNIQLGVATNYGDTTRAQAIQADLAQNTLDTADANKSLKDATAAASTSLAGNTAAAIANRSAVLDLISAYQGQIQAFVNTGASASQVSAYIRTLQGQFQAQLTQLGFNAKSVSAYSNTFNTLAAAVNKVPTRKTVTITADTTQAQSALGGVSSKINSLSGQLSNLNAQIAAAKGELDKNNRASELNKQKIGLNDQLQKAVTAGADNVATRILGQIDVINKKLASGNYYRGGTIGGGNKKVSAYADDTVINAKIGEGVVNLKGMSMLGSDGLNAINKQQNPFPPMVINAGSTNSSSSGIVQVELSPIDRQLLANAGNVTLSIDGKTIANASNATNLGNARRGANG